MSSMAHTWWSWMSAMTVQIALLAGAVALADLVLRRRLPHLVEALWLCVLAKLVLSPAASSPVAIVHLPAAALTIGAGAGASGRPLPVVAFCVWLGVAVLLGVWAWMRHRRLRRQLLELSRPVDRRTLIAGEASRCADRDGTTTDPPDQRRRARPGRHRRDPTVRSVAAVPA